MRRRADRVVPGATGSCARCRSNGYGRGEVHIETIRDYKSDWQQFLNPYILDLLIDDLLDVFLVAYLDALASASKLRMAVAADRIREDVTEEFKIFSTLNPPKELDAYVEVIQLVLALLESSKDLVF